MRVLVTGTAGFIGFHVAKKLVAASHEVIVYEAATLAIGAPRIERLPLGRLPELTLRMQSTLILPPCQALRRNQHVRDRLEALDREASVA